MLKEILENVNEKLTSLKDIEKAINNFKDVKKATVGLIDNVGRSNELSILITPDHAKKPMIKFTIDEDGKTDLKFESDGWDDGSYALPITFSISQQLDNFMKSFDPSIIKDL